MSADTVFFEVTGFIGDYVIYTLVTVSSPLPNPELELLPAFLDSFAYCAYVDGSIVCRQSHDTAFLLRVFELGEKNDYYGNCLVLICQDLKILNRFLQPLFKINRRFPV